MDIKKLDSNNKTIIERGIAYRKLCLGALGLTILAFFLLSSIAITPEDQDNSGGQFYQFVLPVGFEIESNGEPQTFKILIVIDSKGIVSEAEFRKGSDTKDSANTKLLIGSILKWKATPRVSNGNVRPEWGQYVDITIGDKEKAHRGSIRVMSDSKLILSSFLPNTELKERAMKTPKESDSQGVDKKE